MQRTVSVSTVLIYPKLLGGRPNEKHQKGFEIPTYASLKDLNSHEQNFTWSFFVRMICENGHYIP